jgi:hypothetical protein
MTLLFLFETINSMKSYFPPIMTLLIFSIFGCARPFNSSFSDGLIYGANVTGSANFLEARAVLAKSCFSCHSGWAGYSEPDFVSQNLVIATDLSSSLIYTRLRGNDTGTGDQNMPPSETLASDDTIKIKSWIVGM